MLGLVPRFWMISSFSARSPPESPHCVLSTWCPDVKTYSYVLCDFYVQSSYSFTEYLPKSSLIFYLLFAYFMYLIKQESLYCFIIILKNMYLLPITQVCQPLSTHLLGVFWNFLNIFPREILYACTTYVYNNLTCLKIVFFLLLGPHTYSKM